MKPTSQPLLLALFLTTTVIASAAQQPEGMEPGAPHETRLVIGARPPTAPALTAVADGEVFDLAAQRGHRPVLLHFFRGTW
jgi:hypothetical protein